VVLYECETWSLILRKEHRLRVFENRVLRRIFGTKRDEVTGDWRKLHNEELHAFIFIYTPVLFKINLFLIQHSFSIDSNKLLKDYLLTIILLNVYFTVLILHKWWSGF
jgi:hypothetical protein